MPRVSMGLPIYNGEHYVEDALASTFEQTYEDFELIILDNASTDRTQEICLGFAAKDKRIRYFRNERNLGAAANFNRVFRLSSGEYFKWVAHDDIFGPEFLSKCVHVLDNDQSVALSFSKIRYIDEDGKFSGDYEYNLNMSSQNPRERFRDLIMSRTHMCIEVFGLIRSNLLKKTSLIGYYPGSDLVLLGELSLYGRFYQIDEYLFFNRRRSLQRTYLTQRSRATWFDPSKGGKILFPDCRIFLEFCNVIRRAPMKVREKSSFYLLMAEWIVKKWKVLYWDVELGIKEYIKRLRGWSDQPKNL